VVGAGISVSAGIPDFRTPVTGLYAQLQKYNLPYPESIFDLNYFLSNPHPFFDLAKTILSGYYKPTLSHIFLKEFSRVFPVDRIYTQNIDGLEESVGIDSNVLIKVHGSFQQAACSNPFCRHEYDSALVNASIMNNKVINCSLCGSYVKPAITFFGEKLPQNLQQTINKDSPQCDLLIVIGTSLRVDPMRSLVTQAISSAIPKVLINAEPVEIPDGWSLELIGKSDEILFRMANELNFQDQHTFQNATISDQASMKSIDALMISTDE